MQNTCGCHFNLSFIIIATTFMQTRISCENNRECLLSIVRLGAKALSGQTRFWRARILESRVEIPLGACPCNGSIYISSIYIKFNKLQDVTTQKTTTWTTGLVSDVPNVWSIVSQMILKPDRPQNLMLVAVDIFHLIKSGSFVKYGKWWIINLEYQKLLINFYTSRKSILKILNYYVNSLGNNLILISYAFVWLINRRIIITIFMIWVFG